MASFKVGDPSVEQVPVVMAARKRGLGKSGASLNGRMDGGEDAKQRRQHGDRLVIGLCLCFPTLHACLVDKVGFKVGMSNLMPGPI